MSDLLSKMKNEALSLPEDDRAKLAHELIMSLDEGIDSDVDNAWEAEISRRVQEIRMALLKEGLQKKYCQKSEQNINEKNYYP